MSDNFLRFHVIEDAAVVLRSKGVFRQTKAYRRGEFIYAGYGSGFVQLLARGATSHPDVSWLDTDVAHVPGELGRPVLAAIKNGD